MLAAGAVLSTAPALLWATPPAQEAQRVPEAGDGSDEARARLRQRLGRSLGPPGAEVRSLVLAPSDPERLYLGTATGHLYSSRDAAATWQELPVRFGHETVVDNILVHPTDPDLVYAAYWDPAGTGGIRRSRDGGHTWEALEVPAAPSLRALAMAPSDPSRVYVGGMGGVWRSDDAGASWRNINGQGLASEFIESLAVDPRDPGHLYAGTWRQVYRTRDGGETWARIYQGMAVDRDVFSLAISPHDPETVFAGTCNFLYCSYDGGGSWGERRDGLARQHNRIHAILHDPTDASIIYAGTRGALYVSSDAGASWRILIPDIAVSAVALDPETGRLFVGTEERGVLVGRAEGPFAESNEGIGGARVLAFDSLPGAPEVLFAARAAGAARSTLQVSMDGGERWRPLGTTPIMRPIRLLRAQRDPIRRVVVVGGDQWWSVAPGGAWDRIAAPPGATRALEIAHEHGGALIAATSQGLFATPASGAAALGEPPASAVAADPAPPPEGTDPGWRALWDGGMVDAVAIAGDRLIAAGDGRVVAARLFGSGASVRLDAVRVAELAAPIVALALHARQPDTVYAASRREVFVSRDGGRGWAPIALPWPAGEIRGLQVDPSDPDQLLVLDYRGAIYRAHASGEHWLVLDEDPGLVRAWSFRLRPEIAGFALVATQGHGLRLVGISPLMMPDPTPAPGQR